MEITIKEINNSERHGVCLQSQLLERLTQKVCLSSQVWDSLVMLCFLK